jgi:hypothetical protein
MGKGIGGKVDKTAPQLANFQKTFLMKEIEAKIGDPLHFFWKALTPPGKKKV